MYNLGYLLGQLAFVIGMVEIMKFLWEHWKAWCEKRRTQQRIEQIAREEQARVATAQAEVDSQILHQILDKLSQMSSDQKPNNWKEGYVEDENGKRKIYYTEVNE